MGAVIVGAEKPAGAGVSCVEAAGSVYEDITPKEHHNGPDYLKGCTLIVMNLAPGAKDEPHQIGKHYVYIIEGGKVKITDQSATVEAELKTGCGMVIPGSIRQIENIGESNVKLLILEVGEQSGETPEGHVSAQESNCSHYKVLAEDADWMVVKMDVKAGDADTAHSHREHVVYALADAEISVWGGANVDMTAEGDANLVVPATPGMVLPVPTGFHIVKNTGSTDASMVYFERVR